MIGQRQSVWGEALVLLDQGGQGVVLVALELRNGLRHLTHFYLLKGLFFQANDAFGSWISVESYVGSKSVDKFFNVSSKYA